MLSKIKNSPLVRWIYKMPWLIRGYHLALAMVGPVVYGFPSKKLKVIGITGTKGKTSTLEIVNAIFESAEKKTALLSSVRVKIGENAKKNLTENSMPGRMFIQRFLRRAVRAGCEYAFLEATSQGAIFYRHAFINWAAGAMTNLHPEHIEAHGSFEKYREAKLFFLSYVAHQGSPIFLNVDDPETGFYREALKGSEIIMYSAKDIPEIPEPAKKMLPGEFSRENVALARAIALRFGLSEEDVHKGLLNFKGVPGRAEVVQSEPFRAVVDYAHTAESLEAIYRTMKEGGGSLICVLGAAGGGRDKWKRPKMGAAAGKYCDRIILTDEDPYEEDPANIVSEIKKGILETGRGDSDIFVELDRRKAIALALRMAKPGDTVLATGKGSESWIHRKKGERIPWSERAVFEEELKKI